MARGLTLKGATPLKCSGEGDLVAVFQLATVWETTGNAAAADIVRLELLGEIKRSGFPFDTEGRGQNHLLDLAFLQQLDQFLDRQCFGSHTV